MNTKKDCSHNGVDIKIRIENQNTFDCLDEFTNNIRNQILNATDCHYCSTRCEGKKYTFIYNGDEYVKCQYLGCNFRFKKIDECDATSNMDIVNGEFKHEKTCRLHDGF